MTILSPITAGSTAKIQLAFGTPQEHLTPTRAHTTLLAYNVVTTKWQVVNSHLEKELPELSPSVTLTLSHLDTALQTDCNLKRCLILEWEDFEENVYKEQIQFEVLPIPVIG